MEGSDDETGPNDVGRGHWLDFFKYIYRLLYTNYYL